MNYKLYEVGGKVRDELLGLKSKDVDYTVVLEGCNLPLDQAFYEFVKQIESEGYDVKVEHADVVTVRALFPKDHQYSGVADFVLARKELYYPETGRRPVCKLGTLEDDLIRRDFTVNALAKDEEGKIIDLFDGYRDLRLQSLDTPTDPHIAFYQDPLRILRGIRFCVTKDLVMCRDVRDAIRELSISRMELVSEERIIVELEKMMRFNAKKTIYYLNYLQDTLNFPIFDYIFDKTNIWFLPNNKKK